MTDALKIGKYNLRRGYNPERIWISLDGIEGGDFNEEELEKIIDKFYQENF